ncbi:MAG: hypothetical protein K6T83_21465 [Alicyclobacillus sp.]|nr:hypothetical protein [Alicyclobacillus sp.]
MNGTYLLGNPGHLTKADFAAIHQHFAAIIDILRHAGLDNAHVYEFLMSLGHTWWMAVCGL